MAESLRLWVLTPAERLLEIDAAGWVQVRLADGGDIGIWPGHAPLLAQTVTAPLRYADAQGEHTLPLRAGLLHITREGVTILTPGRAEEAT